MYVVGGWFHLTQLKSVTLEPPRSSSHGLEWNWHQNENSTALSGLEQKEREDQSQTTNSDSNHVESDAQSQLSPSELQKITDPLHTDLDIIIGRFT